MCWLITYQLVSQLSYGAGSQERDSQVWGRGEWIIPCSWRTGNKAPTFWRASWPSEESQGEETNLTNYNLPAGGVRGLSYLRLHTSSLLPPGCQWKLLNGFVQCIQAILTDRTGQLTNLWVIPELSTPSSSPQFWRCGNWASASGYMPRVESFYRKGGCQVNQGIICLSRSAASWGETVRATSKDKGQAYSFCLPEFSTGWWELPSLKGFFKSHMLPSHANNF